MYTKPCKIDFSSSHCKNCLIDKKYNTIAFLITLLIKVGYAGYVFYSYSQLNYQFLRTTKIDQKKFIMNANISKILMTYT